MKSKRILYLDNLKIFLTILVIAHHSAQAYVPGADWKVIDSNSSAPWLSNLLTVNMTFFMGAFFFISGYFIPKAKENKTEKDYIKDRAKRLLIPIVLLTLIIVPLYNYSAYYFVNNGSLDFFSYYIQIYFGTGIMSYDHGWFILALFIYSMIYLLFERFIIKKQYELTTKKVVFFILIMAISSYIVRMFYGIDTWVNVFNFIGFEPAHAPQYIMMLFAGALCYTNNWFDKLSQKKGKFCTVISIVMILILCLRNYFPYCMQYCISEGFALYESVMCVTVLLALIYLFKKYFDNSDKYISIMARNDYGAYIFHYFFVIVFQVALYSVPISGSLKFIFVTVLSIICSFIVAWLFRRIKIIKKII